MDGNIFEEEDVDDPEFVPTKEEILSESENELILPDDGPGPDIKSKSMTPKVMIPSSEKRMAERKLLGADQSKVSPVPVKNRGTVTKLAGWLSPVP